MVEAAWFPSDSESRELMAKALRKADIGGLLKVQKVQYYSRDMSIRNLLLAGVIDMETASDALDFDNAFAQLEIEPGDSLDAQATAPRALAEPQNV